MGCGHAMSAAEATVSVYLTVKSEEEAQSLARALLDRRLIACANFWPIRSVYVWEGQPLDEPEVAMWCKTTRGRVAELLEAVPSLHSYEVPCIEVFEAQAYAPFARWVQGQTAPAG